MPSHNAHVTSRIFSQLQDNPNLRQNPGTTPAILAQSEKWWKLWDKNKPRWSMEVVSRPRDLWCRHSPHMEEMVGLECKKGGCSDFGGIDVLSLIDLDLFPHSPNLQSLTTRPTWRFSSSNGLIAIFRKDLSLETWAEKQQECALLTR